METAFIIIGGIIVLIVTFLSVVTICHHIKISLENKFLKPMGSLVKVNHKHMHVYQTGSGQETLIFLSGHGTTSPTLDFKPLWNKLKDSYQIVVIERFGYGFSDVTDVHSDVDSILENTRTALAGLNIEGPYSLIPHSFSGVVALYWAQKYPNEVKAIIGLDATTPYSMSLLPVLSKFKLFMLSLISKMGMTRLMDEATLMKMLPLLDSIELTDCEKKAYRYLFYKCAISKNMINELRYMHKNVETLARMEIPSQTPMLYFISSKQNERVKGWTDSIISYLGHIKQHEIVILDDTHYLHHNQSAIINTHIRDFFETIVE